MSKIFYKQFVVLEKIEKIIEKSSMSADEKEEYWKIIDEIIHHRVMGCLLESLPREHHDEFLMRASENPADDKLVEYLEEKTGKKMSDEIRREVIKIEEEIIKDIK